jgi:hypothetical protein
VALIIFNGCIRRELPSLIMEIKRTAIRGSQMRAGLRGVMFGTEDMMAIMRK